MAPSLDYPQDIAQLASRMLCICLVTLGLLTTMPRDEWGSTASTSTQLQYLTAARAGNSVTSLDSRLGFGMPPKAHMLKGWSLVWPLGSASMVTALSPAVCNSSRQGAPGGAGL